MFCKRSVCSSLTSGLNLPLDLAEPVLLDQIFVAGYSWRNPSEYFAPASLKKTLIPAVVRCSPLLLVPAVALSLPRHLDRHRMLNRPLPTL